MLHAAKTSLTCCVGFVREGGAREAETKALPTLPPPSQIDLLSRGFPQLPHFKSLVAPFPPLGKNFRLPYSRLVSDLIYIICLFMQLRILSGGAERHVCGPASFCLLYLIYSALKDCFFFFPTLFLIGTNLWYPIYFSPATVGNLIHVSKRPRSSCGFA